MLRSSSLPRVETCSEASPDVLPDVRRASPPFLLVSTAPTGSALTGFSASPPLASVAAASVSIVGLAVLATPDLVVRGVRGRAGDAVRGRDGVRGARGERGAPDSLGDARGELAIASAGSTSTAGSTTVGTGVMPTTVPKPCMR